MLAFKWGEVGHRRDWYQGEISEAIPEHISIKWALAYEGSSCFAEVPAGITFVWGESVGPPALAEAAERRRNLAAERRCRCKSRGASKEFEAALADGRASPALVKYLRRHSLIARDNLREAELMNMEDGLTPQRPVPPVTRRALKLSAD